MSVRWVVDEIGRWESDQLVIQGRFFRTGLWTHFVLFPLTDDNVLQWKFTFRDLGFDHLFERSCVVNGDVIQDVATCKSTRVDSIDMLMSVVFGGFREFLNELYDQLVCNLVLY